MSKNETIVLNPWNPKNKLLTENDVYTILERGGFTKAREVIEINNLDYYQTAFIHPSYVKKHIFEDSVDNNITLSEQPDGVLDLFDENNKYEKKKYLDDKRLILTSTKYLFKISDQLKNK